MAQSTLPGSTPPPYIGVVSLQRTVTGADAAVDCAASQAARVSSGRTAGFGFLMSANLLWRPDRRDGESAFLLQPHEPP